MRNTDENLSGSTQLYYDFFQTAFETIDMTSGFWQPMLKAMGRAQMEMVGLQARQAQAFVHWTHQLMRPLTPFDVVNASLQFWQTTTQQYSDAAPRVAEALGAAAGGPVISNVPSPRSHDRLILLDRNEADAQPMRKVA